MPFFRFTLTNAKIWCLFSPCLKMIEQKPLGKGLFEVPMGYTRIENQARLKTMKIKLQLPASRKGSSVLRGELADA